MNGDRMQRPRSPSRLVHAGLLLGCIGALAACAGPGDRSDEHTISFPVNLAQVRALHASVNPKAAEGDGYTFEASVTGTGIDTPIESETFFAVNEEQFANITDWVEVPGVPGGSDRILTVRMLATFAGEIEDFPFFLGHATGITVSEGGDAETVFTMNTADCVGNSFGFISGSGSDSATYDMGASRGLTIFAGALSGTGTIELIYEGDTIYEIGSNESSGATWVSYDGAETEFTVDINTSSAFWTYEFVCN